jgi:large subunit ribosomal protein L10
VINATGRDLAVVINQGVEKEKFTGSAAPVATAPAVEAPAAEASAPVVEAAHVEESVAAEQPSGAAQPENATSSQAGEAASTDPVEG